MELGPNQKQWVADLRGGRYSQCTLCLYEEGAFCALGMVDREWVKQDPMDYVHVRDRVALIDQDRVWVWNDTAELTFPEIADLIEKHADELFSEPR